MPCVVPRSVGNVGLLTTAQLLAVLCFEWWGLRLSRALQEVILSFRAYLTVNDDVQNKTAGWGSSVLTICMGTAGYHSAKDKKEKKSHASS